MQKPARITDVPFLLRAKDVKRHIVNIDSRFRDSPTSGSASDFYFRLLSPLKNVLRIRITSIEFPNNYLYFTEKRQNTFIRILTKVPPAATIIEIPDGNYTAGDMEAALQSEITDKGLTWLTVTFDAMNGMFTFTGTQYFGVDTYYNTIDRPFDYGLGYNLGLSRGLHKAVTTSTGTFEVVSSYCASFAGDNYVFLRINDFDCVRQTIVDSEFTALAKIILREPKNYMVFDDYASQHAKEVVFPSPQDLTRFHVQILDAYGRVLDLSSCQLSFSMEILEILNTSLYNTIRESITLQYV